VQTASGAVDQALTTVARLTSNMAVPSQQVASISIFLISPWVVYIWLRDSGGPYYFALTAVNTAGVGSVVKIEVQGYGTTTWTPLIHDPNYTEARPQERYGAWVIPQGAGPFNLPIGMRITSPTGEQLVNLQAIKSFTAPSTAPAGANYIDLGMQFTH
jgi:hypothetical protein